MMLVKLLYLTLITYFIKADDESKETKYIDLLPEKEKKEFIETIARRIVEEVTAKNVITNHNASIELTDDEINKHSAYVNKLLKEEAENLRKNIIQVRRETGNQADNVARVDNVKDKIENESDEKSKSIVDLTLRRDDNDDGTKDDKKEQLQPTKHHKPKRINELTQKSETRKFVNVTILSENTFKVDDISNNNATQAVVLNSEQKDKEKDSDKVAIGSDNIELTVADAKTDDKGVDKQKDVVNKNTMPYLNITAVTNEYPYAGDKVSQNNATVKSDNSLPYSRRNLQFVDIKEEESVPKYVTVSPIKPLNMETDVKIQKIKEMNSKNDFIDLVLRSNATVLNETELPKVEIQTKNETDSKDIVSTINDTVLNKIEEIDKISSITSNNETTNKEDIIASINNNAAITPPLSEIEETVKSTQATKSDEEIKLIETENHVVAHLATQNEQPTTFNATTQDPREINVLSEEYKENKTNNVINNARENTTEAIVKMRTEFITGYGKYVTKSEWAAKGTQMIDGSPEVNTNPSETDNEIKIANNATQLLDAVTIAAAATSDPLTEITKAKPKTILNGSGVAKTIFRSKKNGTNDSNLASKNEIKNVHVNLKPFGDKPKEYVVYELLPGQKPFEKYLNSRKNDTAGSKTDSVEDRAMQIEQANYATVYNYAPDHAYYSPDNKYGPSVHQEVIQKESDEIVPDLKELFKEEEAPYVVKGTKNDPNGKLLERLLSTDSQDQKLDFDYYFGVSDRQKNTEVNTRLRLPDTKSEESPRHAILNINPKITNLEQIKALLNKKTYTEKYGVKDKRKDIFKAKTNVHRQIKVNEDNYSVERKLRDIINQQTNPKLITKNIEFKKPKVMTLDTFLRDINSKINTDNKYKNIPLIIVSDDAKTDKVDRKKLVEGTQKKWTKIKSVDHYVDLVNERTRDKKYLRASSDDSTQENPSSVSSTEEGFDLKELNVDAIQKLLGVNKPESILKTLQKSNSLYHEKTDSFHKKLKFTRSGGDLESYLTVLRDMITQNNKALENYNWLGTAVDIRSAFNKLLDLSEAVRKGQDIHPKDLQVLKYVTYLYESAEEALVIDKELQSRRAQLLPSKGEKRVTPDDQIVDQPPWLSTKGMKEKMKGFQIFLNEVIVGLDNLHDAIKHIAMITKYKQQNWFKNLKDLYLRNPTRKQLLEVLLHFFTIRVLGLVEDCSQNGLRDNYVKYVMANSKDVEKVQNEFAIVLSLSHLLKRA